MGYDDDLVHRGRERLADHVGMTENVMLAGLACLLYGNLAVVRTPPEG